MSTTKSGAGKSGQKKAASQSVKTELSVSSFDMSVLGEVRSSTSLQALEPRVLLDAAGLVTGAEVLDQADNAHVDALVNDVLANNALAPWAAEESEENKVLLEALASPSSNEIVFIDGAVEGAEALISSFPAGTEIYILDVESDGVEQIASVLEGRSGFDAIHIFSHGRSGTLDLGSTKLTEASIASRHADEMETIRAALSVNADILIYGCDFGANARGVSAIEALADATGADIAASEDLTGATNLGGDWELEIEVGSVEAEAITAAAFAGVLIDSDGDFIDDLVDDDDDNDGILDVDEKVLSAGTTESFENPPVAWPTDRDGFASAFPTGSSALSNFAGTAGYFTGLNPTSGSATFLNAYEGTSYSGLHSGETFATEIVALALSIPVTAGTDVGLSFAAHQMNFGSAAGGFFNEPGTFQIFGIATGTVQPVFPAAGSIDPDSHITVGAHPDVDLLGTTPLINNTVDWQTHLISFTAAQGYDRILIIPVGTNTGAFLAIDDIQFGLLSGFDTDGDGVDDHLDLDSDNDGISDLIESGQNQAAVDTNNDGRHDGGTNGAGVAFAANGGAGATPIDTDFDGIRDFLDLDSDNDGIADAVEARPTAGYVSSTHFGNAGNNGVNDDGLYVPVNTGGSALADYRDTDSDGDGVLDSAESGLTPGFDGNGDGIGDGVGASYADPDGIVNNPFAALANVDSDASDVDYRSINVPATAPIIDLNDNNTTGDLSFTQIFVEGSVAVLVTDTDADVIDAQDNIISLSIAVSGAVDGNSEQIVVNGIPFLLGTNSVNTSTNVGGVPVTMSYIGGTLTITPTNGVTPLPQAFLDFLVRGITYEHTSEDPTGGARTLTFTATDSSSLSTAAPAISTINVVPVNDAPVAVADGPVAVTGGTLTNIAVLGNDSDPEGDPLTVQSITDPANPGSPIPLTVGIEVTLTSGTKVTLLANGSLNVTPLTPASGVEAINYTIADPSGATSTATLILNVTAGISTPIIDLNDDNTTANLDFAAIFTEDAGAVNVTDIDADAIDLADDIVSVTIASSGVVDGADEIITLGGTPFPSGTNVVAPVQVTVGATTFNVTFIGGTFTLTNNTGAANPMPQADLDTLLRGITYENTSQDPTAGNRTLTFNAADSTGLTTATAAVSTITVVPVNDAPIAVDDGTFDVPAGSSAFLQPLNNDSDPEGDPLTITGIFDPAGTGTLVPLTLGTPVTLTTGTTVTLQAGGVLEVVAPIGAGGPETLDYQISDPNGGTDRANIALNRIAGIGPVIDLNGQPTLNLPTISASPINVNPLQTGGFGVGATSTWVGAVILPGGGTADLRATVTGVDAPGTQVVFLTAFDDPTVRVFTNFNVNDIGGSATIIWEVVVGGVPQVTDLQFFISDIDSVEGIELSKTDLANYILTDPTTLTPSETLASIKLSGSVDGNDDPNSRIGLTYAQTLGAEITYNMTIGSRVFIHDGDLDTPIVGGNLNAVPPDINFEDTFTENGSPVAIGDTDTVATDADDDDLQSATIVLTNAMTDDVLALPVLPAGMVGVIDTGTPGQITITLTGTATKAEYADAIRNITFENTGEDPDTTDRNISVIVNDGSFDSFPAITTIHIIPVNDPPVAIDDNETTDENTQITRTAATGLINPNDTDPDAADTLTLTQVNGSAANVGSQITLASGALLTVQADGSYVYDPNGQFATLATGQTATETFTYQISDGNGGFDTATVTITINGVSGAIVLTNDADASSGAPADDYVTTYIENSLAVTIVDSDSSILDTEDDIVELVVTLTDGLQGDTISFPTILPGSISAAVAPIATLTAPGTLTITFVGDASTTLADWDSVMQSMTFLPSTHDVHNPDPADRHITFVATDATNVSSNTTNTTIHVTPQNDPPTLDLDDGNTGGINAGNFQGSFTEDSGGTPIHSDIVMTDLDDTNFQTAMVTLTNTQTDDEFIINGTAVVSGDTGTVNGINYVVSTGGGGEIIINWTGDATIADYDTALQSISFNNTSQNPDTTQRLIDVVVNDGLTDSPTRTAFIDVISVNDPPVPINPLTPGVPPANPNAVIPNQAEVDSSAITTLDTSIYFNDPDDTVLTYSLGAGAPAWLSINGTTGEIDGTPPADASQNSNVGFAGQYDVVVIASDPAGLTGQTTATFLITNPAPVAEDDVLAMAENDPDITGSVYSPNGTAVGLVGDVDPDGDTLAVIEVDGAPVNVGAATAGSAGGLFTINSNGSYTFSDNGEFEDLAVGVTRDTIITYQISDGEGGFDTATVTVTVTGTNDIPIIIDPLNPGTPPGDPNNVITDVVTVDGTTPATINVDDYMDDPDGDTLMFTQTGLPTGLVLDPVTGIISGMIDNSASQGGPNSDGIYDVTITGTDPSGATVTTTITYTITNPPPVAVDDASTGDEDTTQLGNVITDATTGDTDTPPDSDPLTVTAVTGGTIGVAQTLTYGDLTLNPDGSWTFVPNATANALAVGDVVTETVTYTIDDGDGGTDTADLVITINGTNDTPIIIDPLNPGTPPGDPNNVITDVVTVDGTTPPTINVDDYMDDPDGDTLMFTQTGLPTGLVLDPVTGIISGMIDNSASQGGPNSDGIYDVTITGTDPSGATVTTTITYTITNPAPVAVDDASTGDEDTTQLGNVITDATTGDADTPPDSDPLTVTAVTGGTIGTAQTLTYGDLTLNTDGSWTFVPNATANALAVGDVVMETVTYTIDDGDGGTDTADLVITINGVNDAPIIVDPLNPGTPPGDPNNVITDVVTVDGSTPASINVDDYIDDPDGDTLTFTQTGLPTGLSLDPVTGIISGMIDNSASQGGPNSDGIYDVTITGTDPSGATVTTTITYTITNPAPVAVDDASTGDEDTTQLGNVITDATTGDADTPPDSDPLTVTAVTGGTIGVAQTLTYGDLTLNPDGSWTFVPNATANALAVGDVVMETVTYTIDDGDGGTDTADLVITINGVNDAPIIVDPLNPGTPPGDPNNVITDVVTVDGSTPASINVDDYIDDPDGDTLMFTQTGLPTGLVLDPVTGIISGMIDNSASQGGPNSDGIYDVTITGTDPTGATVTTTITYTITNPPPVAVDDADTVPEEGTVVGSIFIDNGFGVDFDPDGDAILVSEVGGDAANVGSSTKGSTGGMFIINGDGTYSFDPGDDFNDLALGETQETIISYQISDGEGGFDTASVTITVEGANDGPIPIDPTQPPIDPLNPPNGVPYDPHSPFIPPFDPLDYIPTQSGNDGSPFTPFDLSPYFGDPDRNDEVTISLDPNDLPAGLVFDPLTNTVSGTPHNDASQGGDPGTPGTYTIPVTVTDPSGLTFTTNVVYIVTNPVPLVVSIIPNQAGTDGFDVSFEIGPHFNDLDNDTLTYIASGLPTGLGVDPATGTISGILDGNASNGGPNGDGFYPITIIVDDGQGGTVTTTFIFDANPVVVSIPEDNPIDLLPPLEILGDPIEARTGLSVLDAVNGITPLGQNIGLPDELAVTAAVNGIRSLGGGMALSNKDQPISDAIRNQIETDRETGRGTSIYGREGIILEGPNLYLGGQIDNELRSGRGDVTLRTMIYQSHVYVDLMTFGNAPLSNWSVRMSNGGSLPNWINMPDTNLILIEQVADVERIRLEIIARLKSGEEIVFPVFINTENGEITKSSASYQISGSPPDTRYQTASANPLSDEINRLVNAGNGATRALFNT